MEKAPILISVYNRVEHFKQCIDSLRENDLASESLLYIAIDAPSIEEHQKDNQKIIDFAKNIKGFKNVSLFIREENFGSKKNIRTAVWDIFKSHDRIIYTEDDNIFSRDFLSFVNNGLETYEKREDIYAVSGYNYPIEIPGSYKEDLYIWPGYSAWGVGYWREKTLKVNWDYETAMGEVKKFLKNYKECIKYHKIANHYVPNLMTMVEEEKLHGDGYLSLYLYLNNMYSVFPSFSRVRNSGHDGSGLHCDNMEDDIYKQQAIYDGPDIDSLPGDIKPAKEIYRALRNHFKLSIRSQAREAYKLYLMNKTL